ncbi:MAG: hypothetical protein IJX96_00020 [Clostridia bacterium]|nr:hypothetical protein [Clostridia bacterium]
MEIGSEFSTRSISFGENEYFQLSSYPKRYVLSGRTGLYLIAEELKTKFLNISLPDYCCGSMIAPFVKQGFHVSFYPAFDLNNAKIDESVQIVLIMDYFGFLSDQTLQFVSQCKKNGKIVIIDATQTAFSHSKTYELADYIVVSYRKWFDSLCAVVYSKNGFKVSENNREHPSYTKIWRNAAILKEKYLKDCCGDKERFLTLFAKASNELDVDYINYSVNASEIEIMRNADSSLLRKIRRKNAKYLINEVKKISKNFDIQLIFDAIGDEDCPLFVPILLNEDKRTIIRNELIKNNIYCPIHWPIDQRYPYSKTFYHQREFSLICDQRYGLEEMRKQILILSKSLIDY